MAAEIVTIAAALASEISGHTFSRALTVARKYVVEYGLEELAEVRVTVVPRTVDSTTAARGKVQLDYQVDVAIQQRTDPDDLAACDALMGLVEEVRDFIRGLSRLAAYPAAAVTGAAITPIYGYDQLAQRRVFTSVVRVELRVFR